jgi:hypothetical protein
MRHRGEFETFTSKVNHVATVCLRAGLVFTLAFVSFIRDRAAVEFIRSFDVKLDFDVGLKASGRGVARWEGNVLSGEDCDCEMERFPDDGVFGFFVVVIGTIA